MNLIQNVSKFHETLIQFLCSVANLSEILVVHFQFRSLRSVMVFSWYFLQAGIKSLSFRLLCCISDLKVKMVIPSHLNNIQTPLAQ